MSKAQSRRIPVGLQLWSVKDDVARDFSATVAAVAAMGYEGVELAGYGNLDAKGAKAALDGAGLKVAGMHVNYASVASDPTAVISDALTLGAKNVVCSWWPPAQLVSAAACERIGEQLGRIGDALKPFGLRFGFHNHATEMGSFDGRPGFEWLLGAAAPRSLFAELDVYWAHVAGYAPGRFIREQGARIGILHLKDETELGRGPVDFADIFAAADSVGSVEWLIVEQEKFNHAPLESVRICLEQLRSWGRA
jgi:sugar phosphate isomerase/epimerase